MSSIHQTNAGTYRVKYRDDLGRQKSKTFRRKVDAKQFQAQLTLGIHNKDEDRVEVAKAKMMFSEMCDIWLRSHCVVHKEESSQIRDRQLIRDYVKPYLGKTHLASIGCYDLTKYQAQLTKKMANKSVNNTFGLVKTIFTAAVKWGYLDSNPAYGISDLRCVPKEIPFWTFEERDRVLNQLKREDHSTWEVVAFTVHTGLRRGEVEGLLRDCLDFDKREITVKRSFCTKTKRLKEQTKGKTIRRIPMNDLVYRILLSRRLMGPKDRVFNGNFEHLSERRLKPVQKRLGVTVIHFHGLRHTFASHLVMSGVSLFEVQKLLGHAEVKTTMQYAHLAPDQLRGKTDVLLNPVGAAREEILTAPTGT